ncbi:glycosyltransferase family 2 protein [Nafulsella turpanensis]|uniref:glycosyltransferase family 2 protein n=1 Tax=Nafulsella turpanensis TaxID=1265690 RepID=UPI00034CFD70|nr:glycosyltransferase family 2 protein [Nafulsella turpanensis]
MILSVVICTHNRCSILMDCIDSIIPQMGLESELIVVDNNSSDQTKEVCSRYEASFPFFKYVFEPRTGLSVARNTGARSAKGLWVFYIDDDAIVEQQLIQRAFSLIRDFDFDCFGGTYDAWHYHKKPPWISSSFGAKARLLEKVGLLQKGYLCGGIFAIKKEILDKVGGFPENYGVKGKSLAYGEEVYVQNIVREQGFRIGYDPDLKMKHLVAKKKYRLIWQLESHYKLGTVWYLSQGLITSKLSFVDKLYVIQDGGLIMFKNFFYKLKSLVLDEKYYWQNYVIDTLGVLFFYWGKLKSGKRE